MSNPTSAAIASQKHNWVSHLHGRWHLHSRYIWDVQWKEESQHHMSDLDVSTALQRLLGCELHADMGRARMCWSLHFSWLANTMWFGTVHGA